MVDSGLGAQEAPGEDKDSRAGGAGTSTSTAEKGRVSRRSPVYAEFEELDFEAAERETQHYEDDMEEGLVEDLAGTITTFEEGKIVKGAITEIRENEIIVDVGFKSEGTIPVSEFR